MTRLGTGPVEEPDLLALIADPWTVTRHELAQQFRECCLQEAMHHDGWVDPNLVRRRIIHRLGEDQYNPRQLSARVTATSTTPTSGCRSVGRGRSATPTSPSASAGGADGATTPTHDSGTARAPHPTRPSR